MIFEFKPEDVLMIVLSALSLFVAIIVLVITYQTWKLKKGQSARASISTASSSEIEGYYIYNIVVENLKERDLIIFGIYLRIGRNVYVDLLNIDSVYDKYIHVIPSLSTRIFELGAPIYYTTGIEEIKIDELFHHKKQKIILQTNFGKIKAKPFKKGWDPIYESFKNYSIVNIKPIRYYTQNSVPCSHNQSENFIDYTSVPKTALYVIKLKFNDGSIKEYNIFKKDNNPIFENLKFNDDNLKSIESLNDYLIESRNKELIIFKEIIKIDDVQELIKKSKKGLSPVILTEKDIPILNWFQFFILAQIQTWIKKIINPTFPSKLFSFFCSLHIKKTPIREKELVNISKKTIIFPNWKIINRNKIKERKERERNKFWSCATAPGFR